MTGYPVILGGDHAAFEIEHADTPLRERPDWPLPSFDARDWAEAFCKRWPGIDQDVMVTWFANALMRGFDEHAARSCGEPRRKVRWGFRSKKQLPLFMVWREYQSVEVEHATVLFSSRDWIGL